jgi:ribosome-binding protein aMBF1 (putative translation factor)
LPAIASRLSLMCLKTVWLLLFRGTGTSATALKVKRTQTVEIPGLGRRIRAARERDPRSLAELCRQVDLSTMYWFQVEHEKVASITEETLRKIEQVLGVDFGVRF